MRFEGHLISLPGSHRSFGLQKKWPKATRTAVIVLFTKPLDSRYVCGCAAVVVVIAG